jgi:hypothetical protein
MGITIIGGLIVSQLLTLCKTPVVYLYFDRYLIRGKPGASQGLTGLDITPDLRISL